MLCESHTQYRYGNASYVSGVRGLRKVQGPVSSWYRSGDLLIEKSTSPETPTKRTPFMYPLDLTGVRGHAEMSAKALGSKLCWLEGSPD